MHFKKKMFSILLMSTLLISSFTLPSHSYAQSKTTRTINTDVTSGQVVERDYSSVVKEWNSLVKDSGTFSTTVFPKQFNGIETEDLKTNKDAKGYKDSVFYWHNEKEIEIEVEVPKQGLYEVKVDYYPIGDGSIPIEGSVKLNGDFPFFEARRIIFDTFWASEDTSFKKDKRGNDSLSTLQVDKSWRTMTMRDPAYLEAKPLQFLLEKGKNKITLKNERGEALIGKVVVQTNESFPTYDEYIKSQPNQGTKGEIITIEGEHVTYRNNSYISPINEQSPEVVPYHSSKKRLNAFGGESWAKSGQTAAWNFEVKESGMYEISLKMLQRFKSDTVIFRTIKIDDELLFEDLKAYALPYSSKWINTTLANKKGENFTFYLEKGMHTISMEVDASPIHDVVKAIEHVTNEMDDVALDIKKLTGNKVDSNRDWDLEEYLPTIKDQFNSWIKVLEKQVKALQKYSVGKKSSSDIVTLKESIDTLKRLKAEPNKIPNRLSDLTEGTGSVSQRLMNVSNDIQEQPLLLDRIYIHSPNAELPSSKVGMMTKIVEGTKQFFLSFKAEKAVAKEDNTLDVWVNRPRKYVELLQDMADKNFTPETGIKVNFSLMPDESKLILANAAGTQPDMALGVSTYIPYELAIRGAALDLRQFDNFGEVIKSFSPGALLPYVIEESMYGIPETQDFYVMFYREDILNKLNIPVPTTWSEVINILPELQMYGMNFNTPLAASGGFKPFMATSPFIYQFGGDLYQPNGMGTAINTEAALNGIKFMSDLFTVYSLPLQTPNFYNHFRYGTLPIGISSFATYVQLMSAAPEIANSWKIAVQPGIENENGEIERWAPGSAQSSMIFKSTKKADEAWELLKWWTSEDVQVEYANQLQTIYGPEYLWNTSNLDAFERLAWPEEHKKVILEQWKWMKEVPKTPATYMLEREISNVWNKIVFDGENSRVAIDNAVKTVNREFARKMEEFGYMKDGKIVRDYPIPTIELVESWVDDHE